MTLMRKKLLVLGVASLSLLALTACGSNKNSSSEKVYQYVYATDPDSLDYIVNFNATTSDLTTNGVDGLLENDQYGNLVPSLAKDWTVSKDGLTYTYKLRKGVKWYTSEGEEYAEVTANDFVAGIKHAVEGESSALYLIQDSIKGLDDYVKGKTKDFSTVGVKALDDYTVQYTLNNPESFWNSKTTAQILFPVNEEFLESKGKKFGTTDPSSILYNGAYFLKNLTAKSEISFEKNPNYWDAKNVHIDQIKLIYNDGSETESIYKNFDDGVYSALSLNPNDSSYKSAAKKYDKNIVFGLQDSTVYSLHFNLNRTANQFTKKTSDSQKNDTKTAILNKDFRQAIGFALNREAFNAQKVGEQAASKSLRNLVVPPTFVQIGTKDFGTVVKEELDNYGDVWKDVNLEDAQDGFYNPEKAKKSFEKAKEVLQSEGVTFPIHLDISVDQTYSVGVNQANSLKQSLEASLGKDNVVIDINQLTTDDYNNTTYFANNAEQKDWDLAIEGWSADYDDPSTFLDIYRPTDGSYIHYVGLNPGQNADIVHQVGLDVFEDYLDEAVKETNDLQKRYTIYAKAQAAFTDSAVMIPIFTRGGSPIVTKLKPYSSAFSWTGTKGNSSFKYKKLLDEPVTAKEFYKAREKWLKEKAKSNAKYEEELADHLE